MSAMQSSQENMQKFGRFLSAMVMPNIGAFIAWGFITALFIPTGWMPNEYLATTVGPMIKWLLPLLIGYTGGYQVYGQRGGVVGAIATSGIVIGSEIPMFLGAMIMGPLGGYVIKKFDNAVEDKIPSGFEMLVNNFSAGILGGILALLSFAIIGPIVTSLNDILKSGVEGILHLGLLPLISIIVEPAKILFLNNAINHGIFSPIGIQEAQEYGRSIFFLIEANPGPGLGVLLAFALVGRGAAKSSAPSAIIIQFLGGIHEIYFPYVLMKPILLLAVIPAGMAGVFTLSTLNGGLIAPASPGSIFAVLAMTPKGAYFANILAVAVAATVSFVISSFLIKVTKDSSSLEEGQKSMDQLKNASKKEEIAIAKDLTNIVYACDAGMGSSAMGASALRNKLKKAGYGHITVKNYAIENIPKDAQLVVTHTKLAERAKEKSPWAQHILVNDFIKNDVFEQVIDSLKAAEAGVVKAEEASEAAGKSILELNDIYLNMEASSKEEAITKAGELLKAKGCVEAGYIPGMLKREEELSTYMGAGIAIPHGVNAVKDQVIKTGMVILQFPKGVDFGADKAYLVIGIAGKGDEHLDILANVAIAIDEAGQEKLQEAYTTSDKKVIYDMFCKAN